MLRGKIYNRERAKQLRDYSGMRYNNITPTDIDGFMEFGDKLMVLFELKIKNTNLPYGQRLALERLADRLHKSGVITYAFVAEHETPLNQDIDGGKCDVVAFRFNGTWKYPVANIMLGEAIQKLIDTYLKKG